MQRGLPKKPPGLLANLLTKPSFSRHKVSQARLIRDRHGCEGEQRTELGRDAVGQRQPEWPDAKATQGGCGI